MSVLAELIPKERLLLIDLVREAGVDVGDWANSKRGKVQAAFNPKYCYDWSFVQPGKVVVLNLWLDEMEEEDGVVKRRFNMDDIDRRNESVVKRRAHRMRDAIETATTDGLPIRVIVCDGKRRDLNDPNARPSKVKRRLLDPVAWAVTDYSRKGCRMYTDARRRVTSFC